MHLVLKCEWQKAKVAVVSVVATSTELASDLPVCLGLKKAITADQNQAILWKNSATGVTWEKHKRGPGTQRRVLKLFSM